MSRSLLLFALSFPLAVSVVACGSDDSGPADVGPMDMGTTEPPDSGVRAKCPLPANNPTCQAIDDMQMGCLGPAEMLSRDSRCGDFCPGWATTTCPSGFCPVVCATGQCVEAPTIRQDEPLNLNMDIGAVQTATFFVRVVVYGETSGGNPFTCADVTSAPTTFFQDPCYNVTDVRAGIAAPGPGNVFTFTFSRVPENQSVVVVVYGFQTSDTTEGPIGISCTELEVPAAGSGMGEPIEFNATTMTFLD